MFPRGLTRLCLFVDSRHELGADTVDAGATDRRLVLRKARRRLRSRGGASLLQGGPGLPEEDVWRHHGPKGACTAVRTLGASTTTGGIAWLRTTSEATSACTEHAASAELVKNAIVKTSATVKSFPMAMAVSRRAVGWLWGWSWGLRGRWTWEGEIETKTWDGGNKVRFSQRPRSFSKTTDDELYRCQLITRDSCPAWSVLITGVY